MTETLRGVVLGGLIGILGMFATIAVDYRRRRTDRKITYLRDRRVELQNMFDEIRETLEEDMKQDMYSNEMILNIVHRCPVSVWAAFDNMMRETERTPKNLIKHHYNVSEAMMKELATIDRKLEKIVGV